MFKMGNKEKEILQKLEIKKIKKSMIWEAITDIFIGIMLSIFLCFGYLFIYIGLFKFNVWLILFCSYILCFAWAIFWLAYIILPSINKKTKKIKELEGGNHGTSRRS